MNKKINHLFEKYGVMATTILFVGITLTMLVATTNTIINSITSATTPQTPKNQNAFFNIDEAQKIKGLIIRQ